MTVEILTLVEDSVEKRGPIAEHGLAMLIETPDVTFLFDTGAGRAPLPNAEQMGVDLRRARFLVLSHGHDDHTGGLEGLLRAVGPMEIHACEGLFDRKFRVEAGREPQYMGTPLSQQEYESMGARFHWLSGPEEIAPGVFATGPVPRTTSFERVEPTLFREGYGQLQPDPVADDQSIVIKSQAGLVVVLGCAHAGIINTLRYATEITGVGAIEAVIGGPHLLRVDDSAAWEISQVLQQFGIRKLGLCHCVGRPGLRMLYRDFDKLLISNSVGSRHRFDTSPVQQ